MHSPDMRKYLPAIAAFILPAIAVKLVTAQLAHAPQSAGASTAHAAAPAAAHVSAATATKTKWSPKQIAAHTYAQTLREQPFGPPPFLFDNSFAETDSPADILPQPHANDSPQMRPVPQFTVGAVMSAASGRSALVNGRPYREGEAVKGTTWIVFAIDCANRSVTLRDQEHARSIKVNVDLPQ